jgi:hypothetical protein
VTGSRRLCRAVWGLWFACAVAFAAWEVIGPWRPHSELAEGLVLALFMLHPPGAFWMVYRAVRYEERPLPTVALACLPYSYIWYYFERVRGQPHRRGQP